MTHVPSDAVRNRQLGGRDVRAAEALVRRLLRANPERVRHSAAVAARAVSLAGAVDPDDVNLLVASAWLHDIGYASVVRDTGFHPLDGARFLGSRDWDPRVCDLVAHHSGSRFTAVHWGLDAELGEFAHVQDPVSDALTVADQAVGPNGRRFSLDERMRDVLLRHGPESPQAKAHPHRSAYFREASRRVDMRLATHTGSELAVPALGSVRGGDGAIGSRLLLPRPSRS